MTPKPRTVPKQRLWQNLKGPGYRAEIPSYLCLHFRLCDVFLFRNQMKTFSCLKTRSPVFSIFSHGSISMAVPNSHLHSSVTDLRPWWIDSWTIVASVPRLWAGSPLPTGNFCCGCQGWWTTNTSRHEPASFVLWGVVKTTAGNLAGVSVLFFTFHLFLYCFRVSVLSFHFHFPLFKYFMFFLLAAFLAALFGFASLMPPAAKVGIASMPRRSSMEWALLVRLQPALQHQQRPGRPGAVVSWMCLAMFFFGNVFLVL